MKTYFGKTDQPYQDAYDLSSHNVRVKNGILFVDCSRCSDFTQEDKRFYVHTDGAISFHFRCTNCNWTYSIYRNQYEDYKKTDNAIIKGITKTTRGNAL